MMKHPLFQVVLLLLICGAVGCVAVELTSAHDRVAEMSSPPVAVVREVPKRGQGAWQTYTVGVTGGQVEAVVTGKEDENKDWQPLRINVSYENLKDEAGLYCKNGNEKKKSFWTGEQVKCEQGDVMDEKKKKELIETFFPEAIKLHTDRLLVKRVKTPLKELTFENTEICSHFAIPTVEGSDKPKVDKVKLSESDFLLYVATGSSGNNAPSSWALTCAVDTESKRPIVGAMRVNPKIILAGKGIVRLLAHELGHALGFDYERMRERGMITFRNIRGENLTVVNSTNVLMKAKEHYNCETMEGVELEDDNKEYFTGPKCTHWAQRYAKDDLMSITQYTSVFENIGYYTALTIAAFEDMGFYKGKFGMAENMSWGRDARCDLINEASNKTLQEKYPNMFCKGGSATACASNRMGMGPCSARNGNNGDINFVSLTELGFCTELFNEFNGLGGPNSWCLDADSLVRHKSGENSTSSFVCGEVRCNTGFVEVRFDKTKEEWHTCDEEDQTFTPNMAAAYKYVSGKVKCPKYSEVCTVAYNGSSLITVNIGKPLKPKPEPQPEQPTENTNGSEGTPGPSKNPEGESQPAPNESTQDSNDSAGTNDTSADKGAGKVPETPEAGGVGDKNKENSTPSTEKNNAPSTGGVTTVNVNNAQVNISIVDNAHSLTTRVFTPLLLIVLVLLTASVFP